jgi:PD-(D/E)XK endonuclease
METNSHHASSILIQIQTSSREEPPREDSPHQIIELHASGHPDNKRRGEASEAEFIARACALDFRIAKPWGESDPYDILVGMGHGFWRVQVKRAPYSRQGQYVARAGGCSGHYTKDNIDFIAAHLLQEDIWYLVPVEAFQGRKMLHFHPKPRSRSKYEKYREAWCLLACDPKARGWKDIPVLCRCKDLPLRCAVCPNREENREGHDFQSCR